MSVACKVCTAANQDEIEAAGLKAQRCDISWREAARSVGWTNYQSIKNHMETHYAEAELREVEDEMGVAIKEATVELFAALRMAPAEVKPLYATAIRNLQGLQETKPSQQHLIAALKTIQEMTGMKQEQRMMLLFAEQMFGVEAGPERLAIEATVVEVLAPLPLLDEAAYASQRASEGGEK